MTENCLEIEDFFKFESLEACMGKKAIFGWLGQQIYRVALKITKIQMFSFRKEKCSSVWSYDKTLLFSDKNVLSDKNLSLQPVFLVRNATVDLIYQIGVITVTNIKISIRSHHNGAKFFMKLPLSEFLFFSLFFDLAIIF